MYVVRLLMTFAVYYGRCASVTANMFSNQKIFLDVKDYGKLGQLEATIREFGGTVEKFLSKDVTCIVTNRARTESGLGLLQKDVLASASTHSQSFRPSAIGNRVISRGQALLMHSNSLKDTSVCEPVAFAEMWGIKIIALDTIVQAVDKQLQMCIVSAPLSPANKQSLKPHRAINKTNFTGAFIKVEDTESNYRPFFSQYLTFPNLDLDGDLSNGIFKCAESARPVAAGKNISTPAAGTRKQKILCRRGYCECCDTMYDDLSQHLNSTGHQRFAENVENFASLDKLIDQIHFSDGTGVSLLAKDNCKQDVVAHEIRSVECVEEMCSSNFNDTSVTAVESGYCLKPSQLRGQYDKPEDNVENCKESHSISGEERAEYCSSLLQSSSHVDTPCVNSKNNHTNAEKIGVALRSPTLEVHCNGVTMSASVAVVSSDDPCKTAEAGIFVSENATNSDDMPQFISSDCVVNLLELLSSENSVHSAQNAEEVGSCTGITSEKHNSVIPMKSFHSPNVSAMCSGSNDTVCNEVLPHDPKQCEPRSASVGAEDSFPLTLMQNMSLDSHCSAGVIEQHRASGDRLMTKCEHESCIPNLSDGPILSPADVTDSKISLITNDEMNDGNTRCSCNNKVDCSASVLQLSLSDVHQSAICVPNVPAWAPSDANSSPVFDDCTYLPVQSDPNADNFDLDNKLLATVYASDVAAHDSPQNFSSAPVASDIIADCFELHNCLLTMGYTPDTAEHDGQQNCSSSHASYPYLADYIAASTAYDSLCLPMTFSPPVCFSEASDPPVDYADASLHTPIHSPSYLLESPATFSAFSIDTSTEAASFYQSSPVSSFSYFAESADVSDSLQSSVPHTGTQRNAEVNVVSSQQVNVCFSQENADLQINSACGAFDAELEYDVKCSLLHGAENCHKSTSSDMAQLETRLFGGVSCCAKPSVDASVSAMSAYSTVSFQSEVNSMIRESCVSTEPVGSDAESDNDSACTVVYNYNRPASSALEHSSDGANETGATVDCRVPFVSSRNSTWKVISCADCRMRLVRTETVSPASFDQSNAEFKCRSSGPELHCVSESQGKADATSNDSLPCAVNSCDCVTSSTGKLAGDRSPDENENIIDQSVCTVANCTWEVISIVDCRMKLARSRAIFPALCAETVSSDSRRCYAKNSCNVGSKLFLSNVADSVLTC